jgi:mono/diheme cytochrome c family protein
MVTRLQRTILVWAMPVLLGGAAAIGGRPYLSQSIAEEAARQPSTAPARFAPLKVELPSGAEDFPAGDGADLASANCLICHSAGMVLRQPPLSVAEWRSEIEKMKTSFGAPITSDQIDPLAKYLVSINGQASDTGPTRVDRQGN